MPTPAPPARAWPNWPAATPRRADRAGIPLRTGDGSVTSSDTCPSGSHRLGSAGGIGRSHDNAGNTTQIVTTSAKSFVYGDHGRMTEYREGLTLKNSYVYNGRGEQVRRSASPSTNLYSVYDDAGQWLGEYTGASGGGIAPKQLVIWLGDLPIGVLAGGGVPQALHYIEPDALGTPRAVIDPARGTDGVAVWAWDLAGEAFGDSAPDQDPDGDATDFVFDMRFPGQRHDAVSGLNYNYFRDYDPGTGRYVQSDPIGLGGGISTYGYVGAGPLNAVDPSGLVCIATGGTVRCQFGDYPGFSFPRPEGWPDRIDDDQMGYHGHDIPINVGDVDAECLRRELIKQPTPNSRNGPATGAGTPNDATPDKMMVHNAVLSPVISYAFVDRASGNRFIVNVTQPGHGLFPGYLARGVRSTRSGTIVNNFGEGTAFVQAPWRSLSDSINSVWEPSPRPLASRCGCAR